MNELLRCDPVVAFKAVFAEGCIDVEGSSVSRIEIVAEYSPETVYT